MAAGKEQRNNGRARRSNVARHGGARLPNGLSKVRRGPGPAQRTDGLCHCSRRAVPSACHLFRSGTRLEVDRVAAIMGRGQALGNGSAGAMAQHLTQTK